MRPMTSLCQDRFNSETTTLCHCWKVVRKDGEAQGFTDHDENIVFDDLVFVAEAGLQSRLHQEKIGLAGGTSDVTGALVQLSVDETTLAAGLFDGASVETWLVDWSQSDARLLMNVETIGHVRRYEFSFSAQLQPLAQIFDQETGRRFLKNCSADLGDAQCGVQLDVARYRLQGAVVLAQDRGHFSVEAAGYDDVWFTGGRCRILSGAQAGLEATIRTHRQEGTRAQIALWEPLAAKLETGDRVEIRAGCDKSFVTCGEKFSNRVNFRGFPHIPGNDVLMAIASSETKMDGGSLFK